MRIGLVLAAFAALAFATPSLAQPAPDSADAAAEAASAAAEGEAILRAANAQDLFANESGDSEHGTILLRHRNSGLQCSFNPGGRNRVIVFPTLARGQDVGCDGDSRELNFTFYATRYPTRTTIGDEIDGAVEAMRVRIPDLRPYQPTAGVDPQVVRRVQGALPDMGTRWFAIRMNGRDYFTRVSVLMHGDWVIKMRITAPRTAEYERLADLIWYTRLAVSFAPELLNGASASTPPSTEGGGGK